MQEGEVLADSSKIHLARRDTQFSLRPAPFSTSVPSHPAYMGCKNHQILKKSSKISPKKTLSQHRVGMGPDAEAKASC